MSPAFLSRWRSERQAPPLLLVTDPGPDPDDVKALLVAASLHRDSHISLRAVVANGGGQPRARAALARCLLDHLGLCDVPVGVGSHGVPYDAQPHEYALHGYEHVDAAALPDGAQLMLDALRDAAPKSVLVALISSLRDFADLLLAQPQLVIAKLAKSFAERTHDPVMRYLADAQFLGLQGLWRKLCDGQLPPRCSKQWFFETFCGVDRKTMELRGLHALGADADIVAQLNGTVKPYDVIALMSVLPSYAPLFARFESARFTHGGVTHLLLLRPDHAVEIQAVLHLLRDSYHSAVLQRRLQLANKQAAAAKAAQAAAEEGARAARAGQGRRLSLQLAQLWAELPRAGGRARLGAADALSGGLLGSLGLGAGAPPPAYRSRRAASLASPAAAAVAAAAAGVAGGAGGPPVAARSAGDAAVAAAAAGAGGRLGDVLGRAFTAMASSPPLSPLASPSASLLHVNPFASRQFSPRARSESLGDDGPSTPPTLLARGRCSSGGVGGARSSGAASPRSPLRDDEGTCGGRLSPLSMLPPPLRLSAGAPVGRAARAHGTNGLGGARGVSPPSSPIDADEAAAVSAAVCRPRRAFSLGAQAAAGRHRRMSELSDSRMSDAASEGGPFDSAAIARDFSGGALRVVFGGPVCAERPSRAQLPVSLDLALDEHASASGLSFSLTRSGSSTPHEEGARAPDEGGGGSGGGSGGCGVHGGGGGDEPGARAPRAARPSRGSSELAVPTAANLKLLGRAALARLAVEMGAAAGGAAGAAAASGGACASEGGWVGDVDDPLDSSMRSSASGCDLVAAHAMLALAPPPLASVPTASAPAASASADAPSESSSHPPSLRASASSSCGASASRSELISHAIAAAVEASRIFDATSAELYKARVPAAHFEAAGRERAARRAEAAGGVAAGGQRAAAQQLLPPMAPRESRLSGGGRALESLRNQLHGVSGAAGETLEGLTGARARRGSLPVKPRAGVGEFLKEALDEAHASDARSTAATASLGGCALVGALSADAFLAALSADAFLAARSAAATAAAAAAAGGAVRGVRGVGGAGASPAARALAHTPLRPPPFLDDSTYALGGALTRCVALSAALVALLGLRPLESHRRRLRAYAAVGALALGAAALSSARPALATYADARALAAVGARGAPLGEASRHVLAAARALATERGLSTLLQATAALYLGSTALAPAGTAGARPRALHGSLWRTFGGVAAGLGGLSSCALGWRALGAVGGLGSGGGGGMAGAVRAGSGYALLRALGARGGWRGAALAPPRLSADSARLGVAAMLSGYCALLGALALCEPVRAHTEVALARAAGAGGSRAAIAALIGFGTAHECEVDELCVQALRSFKPLPLDARALVALQRRLDAYGRGGHGGSYGNNANANAVAAAAAAAAAAAVAAAAARDEGGGEAGEHEGAPAAQMDGARGADDGGARGSGGLGARILPTVGAALRRASGALLRLPISLASVAEHAPPAVAPGAQQPSVGVGGGGDATSAACAAPPPTPTPVGGSCAPSAASGRGSRRASSNGSWLFPQPLPTAGCDPDSDGGPRCGPQRTQRASDVTMPFALATGSAAAAVARPPPPPSPTSALAERLHALRSSPQPPQPQQQPPGLSALPSLSSSLAWAAAERGGCADEPPTDAQHARAAPPAAPLLSPPPPPPPPAPPAHWQSPPALVPRDEPVSRTPPATPTADRYVVHSWEDEPLAKVAALSAWAERYTATRGRPPVVWIDAACSDPSLKSFERLALRNVEVVLAAPDARGRAEVVASLDAFHVIWARPPPGIEATRALKQLLELAGVPKFNEVVRAYLPAVRAAVEKAETEEAEAKAKAAVAAAGDAAPAAAPASPQRDLNVQHAPPPVSPADGAGAPRLCFDASHEQHAVNGVHAVNGAHALIDACKDPEPEPNAPIAHEKPQIRIVVEED
ncbi:hypothetical protein KFE25_011790 [Diacronema lutheri]|uniref:Uncharacterized protein n=1 Tax=Diacronema lutheri TaxID=2081491 RepID=A0A8J6C4K7_DIALT|nr:hypothetical protein KFE25_011790 [Diacronema lutheri]